MNSPEQKTIPFFHLDNHNFLNSKSYRYSYSYNVEMSLLFDTFDIKKSLKIPKGGNKNQQIECQTALRPKEKRQNDVQLSTKQYT